MQLNSLDLHYINPRGTKCIHIRILCHVLVIINIASAAHPILACAHLHAQLMNTKLCSCVFPIILCIETHHRALFASITCFLLAEIKKLIYDSFSYLTSDTIMTWLAFIIIECLSNASSISHALSATCTLTAHTQKLKSKWFIFRHGHPTIGIMICRNIFGNYYYKI